MMAITSNIEWTDATWNPWVGCTKISPACDHCYAAVSTAARTLAHRLGIETLWGAGIHRYRTSEANWQQPLKWNDRHAEFYAQHGRRRRVFCASLADVFDNEVPAQWRSDLFKLIDSTKNLDWLLLTKRIGNVRNLTRGVSAWPNVWLGATICNQEEADRDIPKLLATPARVRFLSIEPMLGPIDLSTWIGDRQKDVIARRLAGLPYERHFVDWVIAGGESGHHARPMHPAWARSIRDQCRDAGVPFLFKQWGEWGPNIEYPTADAYRWPIGNGMDSLTDWWSYRVGKKAAGRLLDGVTHDGFPPSAP
jgi:protein gp37